MEVVLKGRGYRISDQVRGVVNRKLSKLLRVEPRTVRIEVEIISEKNPRLDGAKRVEASLHIPKRSFRAHAENHKVESAMDELVERLERQLRDFHGKQRTSLRHGGNRLKSTQVKAEATGESE